MTAAVWQQLVSRCVQVHALCDWYLLCTVCMEGLEIWTVGCCCQLLLQCWWLAGLFAQRGLSWTAVAMCIRSEHHFTVIAVTHQKHSLAGRIHLQACRNLRLCSKESHWPWLFTGLPVLTRHNCNRLMSATHSKASTSLLQQHGGRKSSFLYHQQQQPENPTNMFLPDMATPAGQVCQQCFSSCSPGPLRDWTCADQQWFVESLMFR